VGDLNNNRGFRSTKKRTSKAENFPAHHSVSGNRDVLRRARRPRRLGAESDELRKKRWGTRIADERRGYREPIGNSGRVKGGRKSDPSRTLGQPREC